MVRIFPIKEVAGRKKILLVHCDVQRQTLRLQIATAGQVFAHYKKNFAVAGVSSLALSAAAAVAGIFFAKKKSEEGKSGFVSKILSGINLFSQIKGIFARMKPAGDETTASESEL